MLGDPLVVFSLREFALGQYATPGTADRRSQSLDLPDFLPGRGVAYVIEIPRQLQVEPELGFHAEELLETQCGVRSHAPFAVNQLVYSRQFGYPGNDLLGKAVVPGFHGEESARTNCSGHLRRV